MIFPVLIVIVLAVAFLSLATGSAPVAVLPGLSDWLLGINSPAAMVIGDIRLPRTLLSLTVGASLGLSGAALQGLLRNPLADPGLTGASQGGALGLRTSHTGVRIVLLSLAGLLGAGVALLLMLGLAGSARSSMVIMAGLAISTLTGAALAAVLNFAPNPFAMQELVFWLLGSVSERSLGHLVFLLPALIVGGALIWGQRHLLVALSLGEQVAQSLGLAVVRGSRLIVLGVALLVGASVTIAGNIGFVGLLVPHLVRPLVGHRPDRLLLPSALFGAVLVGLADICVRLLPPGREIKLGVLTSLLGMPLFIWLIWKDRQRWL